MKSPEISLVGVTGLQNRGVEALVRPTLRHLRDTAGAGRIVVATQTPDYDSMRCPFEGVEWQSDPFALSRSTRVHRLRAAAGRYLSALGGGIRQAMERLASADCVVATGGDVYGSDYGDFSPHLDPLRMAQANRRKTVLLAQSIGPFRTAAEAEVFTAVARRCNLITVRESLSRDYCIDKLGLPAERVVRTADPGLLLEPEGDPVALQRLVGVPEGRPYVTVSVSRGIAAYGKLQESDHLKAWQGMVTGLLKRGLEVVLVPHVQRAALAEDDRVAVTALARSLGWPAGLHLAGGDFSGGEFKALIGGARFNLAERMHAAIAGLSQGVPTGVIGYSVKGEGILSDLYGPELLPAALMAIGDLADEAKRSAFLQAFVERTGELAAALSRHLPTARSEARRNFELIGELLGR